MPGRLVTLFVCGDVMTGRGVDQILPHPGDSRLWESYVKDARMYVRLAEEVNGPIPAPVSYAWPWGDALGVLDEQAPDVRVINLETAVTRSDDVAWPKPVCYRMNPANLACLTVAKPDVAVLANNHVLDFGYQGMAETLENLDVAGIVTAGAGADLAEARRPAVVPVGDGSRVLVWSFGTGSSGVPSSWGATADRPGVDCLPDLSAATAAEIVQRVQRVKRAGDVAVASVHWGSNWGYEVGDDEVDFAHWLIDGGFDVVHGHSSHHPRPIEAYQGKIILYGCGDFIDDYEGISGHEEYRDDLRLIYLATVNPADGRLVRLTMVPMRARRMSLHHARRADARWMAATLDRVSRPFRTHVTLDGSRLVCAW
ncbi:CapA family protein [Allorhizocola rhizosphaerae]|uniref:CapA family protein n=1 Tax=Allorhizocola rhizosphaerae TaxID=1872709 RepID=UPI000E3CC4E0|nr:CapA family protein [Allorhizocola rhizosphaerae]